MRRIIDFEMIDPERCMLAATVHRLFHPRQMAQPTAGFVAALSGHA
jgi:hypothetical protein